MNAEQLIQSLSRDVPRVPRRAVMRRVTLGIGAGGFLAIMLVVTTIGIRPDLPVAVQGFPFWMKWAYTLFLALAASIAIARLARPAPSSLSGLWLAMAVPVLILAGIGAGELARTPSTQWLAMWLGRSWASCPWRVLTLSVPIFAGLLWSFRRLAPTRLRAAGAAAGLGAGAWAAVIYCLHCPEASAIFVLTWYSLGIALAALIGAMIGPRLLRW